MNNFFCLLFKFLSVIFHNHVIYILFILEKNKSALENENAEIAADLQRVSQLKADMDRKARNLEQQLSEANAVRMAQDENLGKLESSCAKYQKECEQLNQAIEEVEGKAGNLEVSFVSIQN